MARLINKDGKMWVGFFPRPNCDTIEAFMTKLVRNEYAVLDFDYSKKSAVLRKVQSLLKVFVALSMSDPMVADGYVELSD